GVDGRRHEQRRNPAGADRDDFGSRRWLLGRSAAALCPTLIDSNQRYRLALLAASPHVRPRSSTMKHLIVTAHPNPTSFTYALSNAYADELVAMGHECDCRDLYAMDFNPILQPSEISGHPQPDAQIEQEHIKNADATAFFYPLWWASMPAILKGYIDRVFTHGVAYRFEGNVMRGLLRGQTNLLVTISAAPRRAMQ